VSVKLSAMTGGALVGLILISMGCLFFLGGLFVNWSVVIAKAKAKPGERTPSGVGPVPGVVGSLMLFFAVPALAKHGVDVPWPWLWILLPLLVDPYCLGWALWSLLGRR
jgi:hypothetical protein